MTDTGQQRALQAAQKAVTRLERRGEPKIGVEEFMSVAERFGLSPGALDRIRAVVESEDWGEGPFLGNYYSGLAETKVQTFERVARDLFHTGHALGLSSGTAALHSAFVAVGVCPGTEVICPAIGFFATASAVVMAGGVPVFCDVDESFQMDPAKLRSLINGRTVAIAPTHVAGGVCDLEPILALAAAEGLAVVEDCAQAIGGRYRGRLVGTLGDVGCFSISAYKIVGGGEGGLLITDGELLFNRASQLAESGGLWRPDRFAPPRYEGELFCGTNYRMAELEAAVNAVQLAKTDAVAARFRAVSRRLRAQLKIYEEIVPQRSNDPEGDIGYTLRFFPESVELGRRIADRLQAEGVACSFRGRDAAPDWHIYHDMFPVVRKTQAGAEGCAWHCPRYRERGGFVEYAKGTCPVADDLFARAVTITLNQWFTGEDVDRMADALNRVLDATCHANPAAASWVPQERGTP